MAQIKSFTDLQQSKKLAEILPLESADYCWGIDDETLHYNSSPYPCAWKDYTCKEYYIPCWSLAALLSILRNVANNIDEDASVNLCSYKNVEWGLSMDYTRIGFITNSNLVDVCYGMIVKLHEQKLL